jgi:hypothetical protein
VLVWWHALVAGCLPYRRGPQENRKELLPAALGGLNIASGILISERF